MENEIQNVSEAAGKVFKQEKLTISAAESCTGGAVLNALTNVSGSSRYVLGGVVAYSNRVKIEHLGIDQTAIEEQGAVSKTVALQMAKNVAKLMNSDIGISTTGIAGPGGGSAEKPVGTVWMGFWLRNEHFALKAKFNGSRLAIKQQTVEAVLETARRTVLNIEEMPHDLKQHLE